MGAIVDVAGQASGRAVVVRVMGYPGQMIAVFRCLPADCGIGCVNAHPVVSACGRRKIIDGWGKATKSMMKSAKSRPTNQSINRSVD